MRSPLQFINTQIKGGVWQGDLLEAGEMQPVLQVTHLGQPLDQVSYAWDKAHGAWRVTIILPPSLLSDGVQTCVISDATGASLASFSIICGDALSDDLRAEIGLLRAELDLLQKAFRKHCAET